MIRQRLEDPPPKDDTVVAVRPLRQLTFANSMPSEQCPKPFVIPLYIHTLDSHYRSLSLSSQSLKKIG